MVLCFGFVAKTALITQGCFSRCWAGLTQHQGLFCSSQHPQRGDGGAQQFAKGPSCSQLTNGIFNSLRSHDQHVRLREEGGRGCERPDYKSLMTQNICLFVEAPGCFAEARFVPPRGRRWDFGCVMANLHKDWGNELALPGGYKLGFEGDERQILQVEMVPLAMLIALPYTTHL